MLTHVMLSLRLPLRDDSVGTCALIVLQLNESVVWVNQLLTVLSHTDSCVGGGVSFMSLSLRKRSMSGTHTFIAALSSNRLILFWIVTHFLWKKNSHHSFETGLVLIIMTLHFTNLTDSYYNCNITTVVIKLKMHFIIVGHLKCCYTGIYVWFRNKKENRLNGIWEQKIKCCLHLIYELKWIFCISKTIFTIINPISQPPRGFFYCYSWCYFNEYHLEDQLRAF